MAPPPRQQPLQAAATKSATKAAATVRGKARAAIARDVMASVTADAIAIATAASAVSVAPRENAAHAVIARITALSVTNAVSRNARHVRRDRKMMKPPPPRRSPHRLVP